MLEIHALQILESRKVELVDYATALARHRNGDGVVWIAIHHDDPAAVGKLLEEDFQFHPVAIEDAVGKDERPELKEFEDHVFLVAPALVDRPNNEPQFEEIGFFIKGSTLVSITHYPIPCVKSLLERWTTKQQAGKNDVGYILFALLDSILDDYYPRLDALEDTVDELSDEIFLGRTDRLKELLILKRKMLEMRRNLGPFRDVMNSLLRREVDFISDDLLPYYHDLFDNTLRLTELIDTNREALTGLLDIHLSTVSNNLNEVMKKMTVISTVLMSAALIAGIYGMNFKHMPELDWRLGYPMSIGLMVLVGAGIIQLFRMRKWF